MPGNVGLKIVMTLLTGSVAVHLGRELICWIFIAVERVAGETGELAAPDAGRAEYVVEFPSDHAHPHAAVAAGERVAWCSR